jgi:hypothetical protein
MLRLRVQRPFKWADKIYGKGDTMEIEENHPRLSSMLQSRLVTYDSGDGPITDKSEVPNEALALALQAANVVAQ